MLYMYSKNSVLATLCLKTIIEYCLLTFLFALLAPVYALCINMHIQRHIRIPFLSPVNKITNILTDLKSLMVGSILK
jgi:hypothetical protein